MDGKRLHWVLRYTWFLYRHFGLTVREAFKCAEEEYVLLNTPGRPLNWGFVGNRIGEVNMSCSGDFVLIDELFSDTLHRRLGTPGLPPNRMVLKCRTVEALTIIEPLPLLPGESSDRKQYEAPRFKRGKGRRQKDYQL